MYGSEYVDRLTPEAREYKIRALGLDRPYHEQFVSYLLDLLKGDLGTSQKSRKPVLFEVLYRWPATIEITIASIIIAVAIGVPTGVYSAIHRNSIIDNLSRILSLTGAAMPSFFLGLGVLSFFYFQLGWIDVGRISRHLRPPPHVTGLYTIDSLIAGNLPLFVDVVWHLITPAFVLGFIISAQFNRLTRSSMLDALGSDYIKTAWAKGLTAKLVYYKHALRNALIPVVTVIGTAIGGLLNGTLITETIFVWNGLGRFTVNATMWLDFPVIQGTAIIFALIYAGCNLAVDISYSYLNPRIRY
jgi:peptide/nickel transport system permease protein